MEAFQLRLWDGRIGRWLSKDPKKDGYSMYWGMNNNPISNTDPDGGRVTSTHTDENGKVIAVKNDGDLGVYKHNGVGKEALKNFNENYNSKNTSAGGIKMGETWTILGFADFDAYSRNGTIKPGKGAKIDFGSNWASKMVSTILDQNPTLFGYAYNARGGHDWDIKNKTPNNSVYYGSLLAGKYASARDAGNFAAGAIAQISLFPNSFSDYGFGTYNLSGNNIIGSMKMITQDLMGLGSVYGTMPFYIKANFGEHPLSRAGIEAGKNFIKHTK